MTEDLIKLARECGAVCFEKDGNYGNYQAGGVLFTAKEWHVFAARLRAVPGDTVRLDYLQETRSTIDLVLRGYELQCLFRIGGLHAAVDENLRVAIDRSIELRKKDKTR